MDSKPHPVADARLCNLIKSEPYSASHYGAFKMQDHTSNENSGDSNSNRVNRGVWERADKWLQSRRHKSMSWDVRRWHQQQAKRKRARLLISGQGVSQALSPITSRCCESSSLATHVSCQLCHRGCLLHPSLSNDRKSRKPLFFVVGGVLERSGLFNKRSIRSRDLTTTQKTER